MLLTLRKNSDWQGEHFKIPPYLPSTHLLRYVEIFSLFLRTLSLSYWTLLLHFSSWKFSSKWKLVFRALTVVSFLSDMTGIRFTRSHLKYTSMDKCKRNFLLKTFLYKIFPVSCGFMTCLIYPCFVVDHWLFVSHVFCFPSKFLVPFSFRFYVKELFNRFFISMLHHSRNSLKSGKEARYV